MLVTGTACNGALSRGGLGGQVSTLEVGEVAALLSATGLDVQVTHCKVQSQLLARHLIIYLDHKGYHKYGNSSKNTVFYFKLRSI